jgi:hypothetical protein
VRYPRPGPSGGERSRRHDDAVAAEACQLDVVLVEVPDPDGKRWAEALAFLAALGRCEE